jgi:hypothetical protein
MVKKQEMMPSQQTEGPQAAQGTLLSQVVSLGSNAVRMVLLTETEDKKESDRNPLEDGNAQWSIGTLFGGWWSDDDPTAPTTKAKLGLDGASIDHKQGGDPADDGHGMSEKTSLGEGGFSHAQSESSKFGENESSSSATTGFDGSNLSHSSETSTNDGDQGQSQSSGFSLGADGFTSSRKRETSEKTSAGVTNSSSTETNTKLRSNTLGLGVKQGAAQEAGGLRSEAFVSGGITIICDLLPDLTKTPPQYLSTLTIGLTASLGLSDGATDKVKQDIKKSGGGHANVSVGGSGGASITVQRPVNQAEAEVLVAGLEGWKAGEAPPEVGALAIVARITHAIDAILDSGEFSSVLGSADGAHAMTEGESYVLSTELGFEAGMGVDGQRKGGGSMGASFSGGKAWTRVSKVEKGPGGAVAIGHAFAETSKLAASASGSVGWAGAKVDYNTVASSGYSVSFALDPNSKDYSFDSIYTRIMAANSLQDAQALGARADWAAWGVVESRTTSSSDNESLSGGMNVRILGVEGGSETGGSQSVTMGAKGDAGALSGTHTGTNAGSIKGTLGEGAGVAINQTNALDMSLDSEGKQSGTLSQNTTGNLDVIGSFADLIRANYVDIAVDDAGFQVLVQRAANAQGWASCASRAYKPHEGALHKPWEYVRSQLRNPKPPKAWLDQNAPQANKLQQTKVLADFVKCHTSGHEIVEMCLRDFRVDGRQVRDIGTLHEWPNALKLRRTQFEAWRDKALGAHNRFAMLASNPDALQKESLELTREGVVLQAAIDENIGEFESPRAAIDMTTEIAGLMITIREAREWLLSDDGECVELGHKRVDQLEGACRRYKAEEGKILDRLAKEAGILGLFNTITDEDEWHRAYDLYEGWKDTIRDLRVLYLDEDVPQSDWRVSSRGEGGTGQLDMDIEAMGAALQAAHDRSYPWVNAALIKKYKGF